MARETEARLEPALHGGRYRLERVLGTGGMATVWLGHDQRLERPVAIKVMADTLAADPAYIQRFEREARTAAGLSHSGLVDIFDFSAEGERPFLVMEYVPGGTLAERLREEGRAPLPLDPLARELLGALAHVHAAGIVHRDIKPANVLLGADGRARLTDFGIAQPDDATHLTMTGQVVGTLRYLAPEVARGEPATPLSDLYACGMLLRDCGGDDQGLHELIERLCAPEPADRPRSAAAALELVGETPDGEATAQTAVMTARSGAEDTTATSVAVPSPAVGPSDSSARPSARVGVLAGLVGLVVLGAVVLLVVLTGGGSPSPQRATPRPPASDASLRRQLDGLARIVRQAP